MKTYMPLNGLRWSRNSGSANCDMPQSVVFGRPGGAFTFKVLVFYLHFRHLHYGQHKWSLPSFHLSKC